MAQRTELEYWLALSHVKGAGSALFSTVLGEVSSLASLFETTLPGRLRMLVPAKIQATLKCPDWKKVDSDLAWLAKSHRHAILKLTDPEYPPQLKQIDHAPPILYVVGQVEVLTKSQLAIVGSRNPTATGYETAVHFAYDLAKMGILITSGLALGIDAGAHEGALAASGISIAVAGTGLDQIYPAQHKELAERIIEKGALVSEFPIGTEPAQSNFPRRNRIISGLSNGVLIVEAAYKSGSLITANYAAIQSREVFAIPGSIHNPLARGCHQLIKQGAKLVESTLDILEEVSVWKDISKPKTQESNTKSMAIPDQKYHAILQWLGFEVTAIETLVERSQLPPATVTSRLVEMELQGLVHSMPGGYTRSARF